MEALLLAGGFGTRLRPLTYTRPKPLLPVAGRPMVEWVLDRLPPDVDKVVVAVNWLAEKLEEHFEHSDRDVDFVVVRETEPLGTAGAVKNCQEHLTSDEFFVLNADIVSDMDLGALAALHRERGGKGTISLKEVAEADVVNYGVVKLDGQDDRRIRGFVEKPKDPSLAPSRLINAGAYVLDRSVLELIPEGRLVSMEKEIFPQLLDDGFYGLPFTGSWIDVGDPARLRAASQELDPETWHGTGASIADDAVIIDCDAGDELDVGAGARLERCVIGEMVRIADGVELIDCVVGDGQVVNASAKGRRIWDGEPPAGYPVKQVGNAL